jgi:hypothetical protein
VINSAGIGGGHTVRSSDRGLVRPVVRFGVWVAGIALALAIPGGARAAHPDAARIGDSVLDSAALLTFARGTETYVGSFQQDGLLTYRGWEYAAWYHADRRAVISRRKLPHGAWQSTELDYHLYSDDAHNLISMTVTPSDGRIQIAFATHTYAIRYTRSVPDVANSPDRTAWSSKAFERTRSYFPGAPDAPLTFTYPQFETVRGRTLLTYRDGSTHDGRQALFRYDENAAGTWTFLGRFTDSRGVWRSRYGTSTSRYSYIHGFTANPVNGRVEIAFTWREQPRAWCAPQGIGNHDLGYVYSPDGGATWLNNDGVPIGRTGRRKTTDLVSIDDPHVVVRQPIDRGLINQEAQTLDSRGRLHVMTSRVPEGSAALLGGCVSDFYRQRAAYAQPYHSWRDVDGKWRTSLLPTRLNSAGRVKLAFDSHDAAYVVLPDARIMAATAASGWTNWRLVFGAEQVDLLSGLLTANRPSVFSATDLNPISEVIVDRQRLARDGVLTIAYQESPSGPDARSAFRVADFRLSTDRPDRPRSKTPEAPPRPYRGSAISPGERR